MNAYLNQETIWLLSPEILLIGLAVWTYVGGAFSNFRAGFQMVAVVGLAMAAWVMFHQDTLLAHQGQFVLGGESTNGPLFVDYFGHAARWVALLSGAFFVLMASRAADDELSTEYLGSLLLVTAGWMLTAQAGDLVLMFLALELISIPTYILLYLGRADRASQESTAKYFFLSVFSSAILLYGMSFLYGATGSISLADISQSLTAAAPIESAKQASATLQETHGAIALVPLGLIMVFVGVAFKMAVVPMSFYAPDVYQGTTNGNAGLLAIVPKAAGLILLIRVLLPYLQGYENLAWQITAALAIVTMTLGNVLALWQKNVRRLFAYSSIAHAGYMLVGVTVAIYAAGQSKVGPADSPLPGSLDGLGATLFYLLVYILATLGAFAGLVYLSGRRREINTLDDLAGLAKSSPLVAFALAVFLFSLTGLPPLAGFWGKWTLLMGALSVAMKDIGSQTSFWFATLAAVTVINAAISAGYYLRMVGVMFFRDAKEPTSSGEQTGPLYQGGQGAWLVTVASVVLVVGASLVADTLIGAANRASRSATAEHVLPQPETATAEEEHAPAFAREPNTLVASPG